MRLTYGELQEIHRWIPVSEELPKKITKAQRKKHYYPPLLIVDIKMGNSVEVGYFNEKGYFSDTGIHRCISCNSPYVNIISYIPNNLPYILIHQND